MSMTEGGHDIDDLDLLTAPQARLVGALMEKEMVTPDSYPLTLRSLISACNQATSRSPVVDYAETLVDTTLHALKAKGLVRFVHPSHGERVTKYRQVLTEKLDLGPAEQALMTLLLLRGPQTVSELRTRSERMHPFDGLEQVESTLLALSSLEPPLVARVPRQAGQTGDRWIQLLEVDPEGRSGGIGVVEGPASSGRPEHPSTVDAGDRTVDSVGAPDGLVTALEQRVTHLEAQVAALAEALGEDLTVSIPPVTARETSFDDEVSAGSEGWEPTVGE